MLKLIFSDLDGTLLNSVKSVDEKTVRYNITVFIDEFLLLAVAEVLVKSNGIVNMIYSVILV